jgi:two-component system sensor histidine kinase KdpD
MSVFTLNRINKPQQYVISILLVASVAVICSLLSNYIGYKTVALLLLVTVSFIAMLFDILPVLMAALLSALTWNFFFIPPRFTLSISSSEDGLMLLMYFFIAMINAALTVKIRLVEKNLRKKEGKQNTLKLYNTLLNSLSHELRTPIATIIGATDNLQTDDHNLSEQNKNDLLTEISKASLRLNRQVENLLNMSRLESGFIEPKKDWCDINELVYDPISVLIKEELPLFKIDFGLMEEVLYNLIYNAVLYIPKYCIVTVKAFCKDDQLVLIVEDNGNGFPEEELNNVFTKFYRLKSTKPGGTGLGLSIVRGFVEAHDGTITLENNIEGGARFTIIIPAEVSYLNHLKNE